VFNARHRLAERYGLRLDQVEHLLDRYGTETVTLLDRIEAAPELSRPLPGAADHLAVEVLSAVEAEGVPHLDDVLARRTRISIQTRDRGLAAAEPTARLMGRALGWTQSELTREVNAYRGRLAAERGAHEAADDEHADRVRRRAVDLRAPLAGAVSV